MLRQHEIVVEKLHVFSKPFGLILFYFIYLFIYFTYVIGQNELTHCDELID